MGKSSNKELSIEKPPKSILIVNKLRTPPVIQAIDTLLESVRPRDPEPPTALLTVCDAFIDMFTRNTPMFGSFMKTEKTYPMVLKFGSRVSS